MLELTRVIQMIRTSEKLAIRAEILEHEVAQLRRALVGEKKRRKRGKQMGLFDKDEPRLCSSLQNRCG